MEFRMNWVRNFILIMCMVAMLICHHGTAYAYSGDSVDESPYLESALWKVISSICNYSLADIEIPEFSVNGEVVSLTLPDISISKTVKYLTHFGARAVIVTADVTENETLDNVAETVKGAGLLEEDIEKFELDVDIDTDALKENAKDTLSDGLSFTRRLARNSYSDIGIIFERMDVENSSSDISDGDIYTPDDELKQDKEDEEATDFTDDTKAPSQGAFHSKDEGYMHSLKESDNKIDSSGGKSAKEMGDEINVPENGDSVWF